MPALRPTEVFDEPQVRHNRMTVTVEDPVMFTKPWIIPAQKTTIGNKNDYIQPQMCVPNDKEHLIRPSATDQFKCIWCNPASIYGESGPDADVLSNSGGQKAIKK